MVDEVLVPLVYAVAGLPGCQQRRYGMTVMGHCAFRPSAAPVIRELIPKFRHHP